MKSLKLGELNGFQNESLKAFISFLTSACHCYLPLNFVYCLPSKQNQFRSTVLVGIFYSNRSICLFKNVEFQICSTSADALLQNKTL